MGAPRKNRRKYDKPKEMWNLQRINADNALKNEFGLKNMKELWKVQSNISRVRGNVRELLSGNAQNPEVERNIISSLARVGIVKGDAVLDNILEVTENAFLERRLQSVVFRKGMARSMKQARQLIAHGYVAINGKKASRPGYIVRTEEEAGISYYRPIDVNANIGKEKGKPAAQEAEPQAVEAPQVVETAEPAPTAGTTETKEQG